VFDSEHPEEWIDNRLLRPAAHIPHLITALDSTLLNAVVRINGARPAVWNHAAPYDADDRYEPFRENVPLGEWALPYNQRELLATPDFGGFPAPLLIVDTGADEKILAKAGEDWPADPSQEYTEFPALVTKLGWLLTSVDVENKWALFAASQAKSDYVGLLQHWCHEHGRTFCVAAVQDGKSAVNVYPAPEEKRKLAVYNEGSQFLGKLGWYGISPEESVQQLKQLLNEIESRKEQ